jgi:hypothetical protein
MFVIKKYLVNGNTLYLEKKNPTVANKSRVRMNQTAVVVEVASRRARRHSP